jgi:hypothetical protein
MYMCISAYPFITVLSLLLPCIAILFLHLLSTNHKCTQPCNFFLLLRRRGWTGILWWGVLGYVLSRLPFLWCYGVFRCSVPLRAVIVFRDTIYAIIIVYSWHLVICEHFCPYVWNNWSWVMHMMSTWFDIKTGYDITFTDRFVLSKSQRWWCRGWRRRLQCLYVRWKPYFLLDGSMRCNIC